MRRLALVSLCCLAATALPAVAADNVWFGGGIGLAFGDVDYISVEPLVGVRVAPRVDVGGGLIYRYRKDQRFDPSLRTSDYGGNVFARYHVAPPVFLHAEYEYLDYEYATFTGGTDRDSYDSVLAGVGFAPSSSGRASFYALALYNFSYDDDEISPYDDPWVVRVGVAFGF